MIQSFGIVQCCQKVIFYHLFYFVTFSLCSLQPILLQNYRSSIPYTVTPVIECKASIIYPVKGITKEAVPHNRNLNNSKNNLVAETCFYWAIVVFFSIYPMNVPRTICSSHIMVFYCHNRSILIPFKVEASNTRLCLD